MLLTGSLRFVLVKIGCVILYLTEAYLILPVAVIVPKLSVKPTIVCVEMENILITSCLQKWSSGFGSTCLPILNIGRLGRFFYAFSRINRVHQLRFNTIIPICSMNWTELIFCATVSLIMSQYVLPGDSQKSACSIFLMPTRTYRNFFFGWELTAIPCFMALTMFGRCVAEL